MSTAQGSLTLTVRTGDTVVVDIPGREPVMLYLARADGLNRASINIRAPREYRISRVEGYERLSHVGPDES